MPDGGRAWTQPVTLPLTTADRNWSLPTPTLAPVQAPQAQSTSPGLGKVNQYVTLVAQGGTPVTLCDAFGNPYPTTGYGALVRGAR